MQFKFCQNKKVMDNHLALMQLSGTSDHLLKQRKEQMEMEIFSKVVASVLRTRSVGKQSNLLCMREIEKLRLLNIKTSLYHVFSVYIANLIIILKAEVSVSKNCQKNPGMNEGIMHNFNAESTPFPNLYTFLVLNHSYVLSLGPFV